MSRRAPVVLLDRRGRWGAYAAHWPELAPRLLAELGRRAGLGPDHELSLLLCDNRFMHQLNHKWRGKDQPTDVLSFPLHQLRAGRIPPPGPVGDIILAVPVVRRAALEYAVDLEAHLRLLLAHGVLHLLGYDHQTDSQHRRMRAAELALLGETIH